MPAHIKPAFKTGEELLAWDKEQGAIRSAAPTNAKIGAMKMQRTLTAPDIRHLHQQTAPLRTIALSVKADECVKQSAPVCRRV